ncbi:U-scoloptoxin(19)-Sm1a [Formica exsecta]|uniref:U-scoloptoxin(19)-Sm1a n=1 Tax=Formica exsecta TaxID=72781 RepID=UPI0011445EB9|nr:U-scoloptoxin(19)-Sm1a [Formica exsecta]
MRSCTLIIITLATVLLNTKYINAFETCPQENCLTSDKCEETINIPFLCYGPKQGTTCCSIVKSEFRTLCRHHGGECMDRCALTLQQNAVDCPSNQVCCVLV